MTNVLEMSIIFLNQTLIFTGWKGNDWGSFESHSKLTLLRHLKLCKLRTFLGSFFNLSFILVLDIQGGILGVSNTITQRRI